MVYKWCAVPQCTNTTIKTPEKFFICVPKNGIFRKKWLQLARRNPADISTSSTLYFCEDHFNLEKDMLNYTKYKMGFSKNILMMKGILPSKFDCQQDRKKRLSYSNTTTSRKAFVKRQKTDFVQEVEPKETCEQEDIPMLQEISELDSAECPSEYSIVSCEKSVQVQNKVSYRSKAVEISSTSKNISTSPLKPTSVSPSTSPFKIHSHEPKPKLNIEETTDSEISSYTGSVSALIKRNTYFKMNEEIPKSTKSEEFVKSECKIEDEENINKSIQLEESEGVLKSLLVSHLLSPFGEDNAGHIEEHRTTYSYNDFEHIESGKLKCLHCNFTAYFSGMIKEHMKQKHLKIWNYECDLCEFKAYNEQSVFKHLKSNHLNLNDGKCYKCNEEVKSKADYEKHIKNHHFSKKKCTKCDFSTSNNRTLKSHINTVHKRIHPKYKCQYCNYKSNRQKPYRTHVIKVHLTIKKCDFCHYTANTSRIIEEHVSNVHLKRVNGFKCIYCNYHTTKRNDLKIHFEINHFNNEEPSEQIETKELYVDKEMSDEEDIHIGIKTEEVMLDDFELPLEGTLDTNDQMLSEENFEEIVKREEEFL